MTEPTYVTLNSFIFSLDESQPNKGLLKRWAMLTPREQEVALLAAINLTNREIAYNLTISHETVKTHMQHICEKLDLYKRDLTFALLTNGLTEGILMSDEELERMVAGMHQLPHWKLWLLLVFMKTHAAASNLARRLRRYLWQ